MATSRTYYIKTCPLREEGCSQGRAKPRFIGGTEEETVNMFWHHLTMCSHHWKGHEEAAGIAEGCEVIYHDEVPVSNATRSRPSSSLPAIEEGTAATRRRLVGPGEEVIIDHVLQTAMLAVASARHVVALCASAALAFEEQASVFEDCVEKLNATRELYACVDWC